MMEEAVTDTATPGRGFMSGMFTWKGVSGFASIETPAERTCGVGSRLGSALALAAAAYS